MSTSNPNLKRALLSIILALALWQASSCSTVPTPKFIKYGFPKDDAFVGDVSRPYEKLGLVRAKVNYNTLDFNREETDLCKNYYNAAVKDLVKLAKKQGGDAVIDVKSVVFFENGKQEMYQTPECSDDGEEGQVLAQGVAVIWKKDFDNY